MANKVRGEVAFAAGDKSYTLLFDINALCELEDVLGEGALAGGLGANGAQDVLISLKRLRAFVWCGLRRHHGVLTLADAGDIVGAAGIAAATAAVGEALQAAFPDPSGPFDAPAGGQAG
jgi:hypothetical protein